MAHGQCLSEAGEAQAFICMMLVMSATHISFLAVWLAYQGAWSAFAAAAVASVVWHAAWKRGQRAAREVQERYPDNSFTPHGLQGGDQVAFSKAPNASDTSDKYRNCGE